MTKCHEKGKNKKNQTVILFNKKNYSFTVTYVKNNNQSEKYKFN